MVNVLLTPALLSMNATLYVKARLALKEYKKVLLTRMGKIPGCSLNTRNLFTYLKEEEHFILMTIARPGVS